MHIISFQFSISIVTKDKVYTAVRKTFIKKETNKQVVYSVTTFTLQCSNKVLYTGFFSKVSVEIIIITYQYYKVCFLEFYVLLNSQDVGLAAGTGDEGYFVPPVKGTSQSQVITQLICHYRM